MTKLTHYEVLKIENTASSDEIKRAYYKLVREFPPERFPDEFRTIREAYDTLSDGEQRSQYDSELEMKNKLAGELTAEAIEQMELIEAEIERAHTGNAVKAAENLFAQYPGNSVVIFVLIKAYIARGWKNKAMELIASPEFQNILKTYQDWEMYSAILRLTGFDEMEIFVKTVEGISEMSQSGNDDIDMCVWVYYNFSQFSKKELAGLTFPERFNTPEKILYYILELSERGLKTKDAETFIMNIITPITDYKSPSELDSNDIELLRIIIDILQNSVDGRELRKSRLKQIIEGVEYIVNIKGKSNPEYRMTPVRAGEKIGRNAPCPCGSGKKYKKCCAR